MFKIRLIQNKVEQEQAFAIRQIVFVEEQQVRPEEEYDEFEEQSRHWIVIDEKTQKACGTARWRYTPKGIKLERFAILQEYRGQGVGSSLVKAVLADVAQQAASKGQTIYLHAQIQAVNLYARQGFTKEGPMFEEAGIQHYKMIKQ